MGSGDIMGQIRIKEIEIEQCRQKIQKTENLLQQQENSYDIFLRYKQRYEDSFSSANAKNDSISMFAGSVTLARKYNAKMAVMLGTPLQNAVSQMENTKASLQQEMQKTDTELDELNILLRRLQAELDSLYSSYRTALAQEEEERARAAAAAAAAAAGPKR